MSPLAGSVLRPQGQELLPVTVFALPPAPH